MSHRQEQIQCYIPSSSQPTLTHVSRCITLKPEARGWKDPDFKANLSYLMRPHLKNQTKSKKKRENILNGWIMYHVKSAWMKASQMKASRSFRWKSSASQLIITRNVRALFFFFPCVFQASLSLLIDRVVFHQLILLNLHLEQKLSENDGGVRRHGRWYCVRLSKSGTFRGAWHTPMTTETDWIIDNSKSYRRGLLTIFTTEKWYVFEEICMFNRILNITHVMHMYIKNITWDMSLICTTLHSHISILK